MHRRAVIAGREVEEVGLRRDAGEPEAGPGNAEAPMKVHGNVGRVERGGVSLLGRVVYRFVVAEVNDGAAVEGRGVV